MCANKKSIIKKKQEFRYHPEIYISRNGRIIYIVHPAFIILEENGNYIYVTITHSKKVKGKVVLKLNSNPNPKDNKEAYWVMEIRCDKKERFGKKRKKWELAINDINTILNFFYNEKNGSAIR